VCGEYSDYFEEITVENLMQWVHMLHFILIEEIFVNFAFFYIVFEVLYSSVPCVRSLDQFCILSEE
jgi:hypothetical protein